MSIDLTRDDSFGVIDLTQDVEEEWKESTTNRHCLICFEEFTKTRRLKRYSDVVLEYKLQLCGHSLWYMYINAV